MTSPLSPDHQKPDVSKVDVAANRKMQKWSMGDQAGRVLWALLWPLFRFSPRIWWWWRRFLLRMMGAQIGRQAHIYSTVQITIPWHLRIDDYAAVGDRVILYALGEIQIGEGATISQGAHLCAGSHDYRDPKMPLLKTPIRIDDGAWICADAFIGPGVTVGERAIVGARAVVVKDVAAGQIVAGNPARPVGVRQS